MKSLIKTLMLTTAIVSGACLSNAYAETNDKEITALAKILSLSKDVPAGAVEIAVVYDPSNAASKADLDAIKGIIGGGFKGPKHTLTVKAVEAGSADSVSGAKTIIMTEGISGDVQTKVLGIAKSSKALTATTDISYVEAGNCVLGIDVSGGVKIIINGQAYKDSGLQFDAAFEFMVKEI